MTDVVLRTADYPKPTMKDWGKRVWEVLIPLDDGTNLRLCFGRATRDALRSFVLEEELHDAADEAQEKLDDSIDRVDKAFEGAEWKEKCGYCLNEYFGDRLSDLRRVQLNHDTQDPGSWQNSINCCSSCRRYLHGQFRYVR